MGAGVDAVVFPLAIIESILVGGRFGVGWGCASLPVCMILIWIAILGFGAFFESLPSPARFIATLFCRWIR